MAQGRLGRGFMWPILVVDLVVYLIILGLSSWSLNKYIDGQQNHPPSTTGVASVVAGFTHFRAWSVASMAAAASSAAISWAISGLAFGLAWKEVKLGGRRGKRLQTLEIFLIISTLIHLLYIMLLHAGSFNQKYGLSYGGPTSEGPTSEAQKTTGSEPHVAA
ncbi:membrane protein PM19L isoform X2 [Beta vulgaris subsp. vulgaris]|uniref:membrane protein PM19L isoform X2 n=1 Tax=Beta vulgaris subsp. vulgaris TaxID=3555 RepID=UPI0020371AF7|nr:membrane protein PM19L isoform X2 [Beta vulgaris subsp. vulgaris]